MRHVDEGTLHALLDGALRAEAPAEADRVEAHLNGCADCRARLDAAAELRDRAGQLLEHADAGAATEDAPIPDFQEVLARAGAGDGPHSTIPVARRYRWTRGVAWAATIVIALGTGWMVRDLADPTGRVPAAAVEDRTRAETGMGTEAEAALDRAASAPVDEAGPTPTPPARTEAARPEAAPTAAEDEGLLQSGEALEPGVDADLAPITVRAAAGAGGGDEVAWTEVTPDAARDRVGRLLVLPGARLGRVEVATDGTPVARTAQLLPGGVELAVVQAGATDDGAAADSLRDAVVGVTARAAPAEAAAEAAAEADGARRTAPREQARRDPADAVVRALAVENLSAVSVRSLDSLAASTASTTVEVVRYGATLTVTGPLPDHILGALARSAEPGG